MQEDALSTAGRRQAWQSRDRGDITLVVGFSVVGYSAAALSHPHASQSCVGVGVGVGVCVLLF